MSTDTKQASRGHSVVGASSADRWVNCPGSNNLIAKAPPEEESSYAAEGTCAHELAEHALLNSGVCADYIGMEWEGHTVTEEMAEFVQTYVDYVTEAGKGPNKDTLIEESFDLDFIREGMHGSNDAIVMEFMGTLEVIDLKYGKGKEVFAKDNRQLSYYALGASNGHDFSEVKLTIIQPRIQNPIKSHTMSMKELEQFGVEIGKAVDATRKEDAPLAIGDHCFFCRAKGICPEQKRKAGELAKMDFDAIEPKKEASLPAPELMDERTLMNVLDHADDVKKWIAAVQAYALHRLNEGEYVKGYKLVESRSNRKVKDEMELKMAFGDDIYEKKLLGIGKLEKAFGKKQVAEFLYKPKPGLTMAREEDKRPEVEVGKPVNDFDNVVTYDDMEF